MNELLPNLGLIFFTVTAILWLFHKIHIPGIVGLIIAGVVIGPYGFGVLADRTQISLLADLGVILLMFSIGLDFDRNRLLELKRASGIGFFQIATCIAVAMPAFYFIFGESWQKSLFFGFLLSHTSSTLMLKIYSDRGEVSTAPSRLGLGVSITQDLASVPMLICLPLMAFGGFGQEMILSPKLLQGAGILAGMAIIARWVVPPVLRMVVQSRSRELILFFLILICLSASWATHAAGLSAALGAFIAGLALAGSHYSHQIHAEVSPLRDLLVSLFFVSVGMLLNLGSVAGTSHIFLPLLGIALVVKFFSGFIPVLFWGYPLRIATLTGVAISQIGEFSFILALVGLSLGIFNNSEYQIFIVLGILSMLTSPFLIALGPKIFALVDRLPFPDKLKAGRFVETNDDDALSQLQDHVLIAGYGLNGRNLTRSLNSLNIPYAAIELIPEVVLQAQDAKERVYFGDCTRPDVLRRMKVDTARVLVVAISDPQATRRAVQVARHENAAVHIIVRTRYVYEIDHLLSIGANEVIPEEFETSLEILARTLKEFQIPRQTVDQAVLNFRSGAYQALRQNAPLPQNRTLLEGLSLALEIESAKIRPGFLAVGKTLKELALPSRTGVVVLGVRKADEVIAPPPADYKIVEQDMLILVGNHRQLVHALNLIEGGQSLEEVDLK